MLQGCTVSQSHPTPPRKKKKSHTQLPCRASQLDYLQDTFSTNEIKLENIQFQRLRFCTGQFEERASYSQSQLGKISLRQDCAELIQQKKGTNLKFLLHRLKTGQRGRVKRREVRILRVPDQSLEKLGTAQYYSTRPCNFGQDSPPTSSSSSSYNKTETFLLPSGCVK